MVANRWMALARCLYVDRYLIFSAFDHDLSMFRGSLEGSCASLTWEVEVMAPGSSGYGKEVEVAGLVAVPQTHLYKTVDSDLHKLSVIEYGIRRDVCGLVSFLEIWGTMSSKQRTGHCGKLTMRK